MKKSVLFRIAQMSVLRDRHLSKEEKLDVIRLLAIEENIATLIEKDKEPREAFKNACEDNGGV